MIVNEISLKKFLTYTNSVYDIQEKFKGLERENKKAKTKASTGGKTLFAAMITGLPSINELNNINNNNKTNFKMLYKRGEYIPKTHGLRDCIEDTDYNQLVEINEMVIKKARENKVFRNNKVDGLIVGAWDGVEIAETSKNIEGLPERERKSGTKKYVKYVSFMNIGPKVNIVVNATQLLEREKIMSKTGQERAKTTGETKIFEEQWTNVEKLTGCSIDVHVFDALYLNQNVTNLINQSGKYFVIRLKDPKRDIYKDAEGLFTHRDPDQEYEIVEIITVKDIKYSKTAKKKDKIKTKIRTIKREITTTAIGEKVLIDTKDQIKKNSTVRIKTYERVKTRKKVWSDEFDLTGYEGKVRVVRSVETNKDSTQELYVVTNLLNHDVETILKIMHLRWNIENCGFRTLKQRYNLEHIFIGDLNSINYIVQMIFLAFNLFELYTKVRLRIKNSMTWSMVRRIFEKELHEDKALIVLFNNTS